MSLDFFFPHLNALINMEKWIGLLVFFLIENNIGIYCVQIHTNILT